MSDKRTKAQLAFDTAKHGWAFCNKAMLEGKLAQLEQLAVSLPAGDKRHQTLETIRQAAQSTRV